MEDSIQLGPLSDSDHAIAYTLASTAITISSNKSAEASDPVIARDALVTVRVTYLFRCAVPLVSGIMCHEFAALQEKSESLSKDDADARRARHFFSHAEPALLASELLAEGRFLLLEAQMTLPNQGAAYVNKIDEDADEVEDP